MSSSQHHKKLLKINASDNVAVALVDLMAKEVLTLHGESITVLKDTPRKHKIALENFEKGDRIINLLKLAGIILFIFGCIFAAFTVQGYYYG